MDAYARHAAPTIVWFRRDLRLADNAALQAAVERGAPIVPVYVFAPDEEAPWAPGSASRVWLHDSLLRLDEALRSLGSRLILRRGPTPIALSRLIDETGAKAVYWNRLYEPAFTARDAIIKRELAARGLDASSFGGALLFEPFALKTKAGGPFQVFTPYWRACLSLPAPGQPQPAPRALPPPMAWSKSDSIDDFALVPKTLDWPDGIRAAFSPGEAGAQAALRTFAQHRADGYKAARDVPSRAGTSRISPHLHFGEVSPRQAWHAGGARWDDAAAALGAHEEQTGVEAFRRELGWREFAHHVLVHFPHTPEAPLHDSFARFDWETDDAALSAWQRGRTGYPIVDAGLRELWQTGYMHNRVRMITASFLVKDLLQSWTRGAAWFWDTLVDADLASNTMGWQWTSGCGADAAPYFRVFNPVSQGKKFDPEGTYVRRYLPELSKLSSKVIHAPWEASPLQLSEAGVILGRDYPRPIVDHAKARERALSAFARRGKPGLR